MEYLEEKKSSQWVGLVFQGVPNVQWCRNHGPLLRKTGIMLRSLLVSVWKPNLQWVRLYHSLLCSACDFVGPLNVLFPWLHHSILYEQYVENFAVDRSWNGRWVVFAYAVFVEEKMLWNNVCMQLNTHYTYWGRLLSHTASEPLHPDISTSHSFSWLMVIKG